MRLDWTYGAFNQNPLGWTPRAQTWSTALGAAPPPVVAAPAGSLYRRAMRVIVFVFLGV